MNAILIILFLVLAQTSNPFQIITVADEDMEAASAGYSLDVQQLACGPSTYGAYTTA